MGYLKDFDGSRGSYSAVFDIDQSFDSTVEALMKEFKGRGASVHSEPDSTTFYFTEKDTMVSVSRFAVIRESFRKVSQVTEYRLIPNKCAVEVQWNDPLNESIRRWVGIRVPFQ